MSRLEELGVVELLWQETDDGTVYAYGLQQYVIHPDNEVSTIRGDDIETRQAVDFCHAVGMVGAGEAVCRWRIREGTKSPSDFLPDRGRIIDQIKQIQVDLYQAYDLHQKEMSAHGQDVENYDRLAEGIAHTLGILKGTTADVEWVEIEKLWKEANGA